MKHEYEFDVCVVGVGRVGLPWAAVLADSGFDVACVDVDEETVAAINDGELPWEEPGIDERLAAAHDAGSIRATTDPSAVADAKVAGFCLYCKRDGIDTYLSIMSDYADHLDADQVVVNRSTLPLSVVSTVRERVADGVGVDPSDLHYVVFPERTGVGDVLEDMRNHPAILGTTDPHAADVMTELFEATLRPKWYHVDEHSAMFVKLIDNTYRDAVFALANYYVVLADAYDLPVAGSRLVRIADDGYKNDIYLPGPVGGKCLTKDSHFLTGEWSPDEFDVFGAVRGIHEGYYDLVVDTVLEREPESVAILGTAFKPEVGNEVAAPGLRLRDRFEDAGIAVECYDPHVPRGDSLTGTVADADLTVLAMNHRAFAEREGEIREAAAGPVLDLWGLFDGDPAVVEV